jgi:hypothetical protein
MDQPESEVISKDTRVHRREGEPGANNNSKKGDERRVNHDESAGVGGDA